MECRRDNALNQTFARKVQTTSICMTNRQLRLPIAFALTLTEPLALRAYVIAKHRAEHEILFGGEMIEGTRHNHADGIKALFSSEIQIQAIIAHWLNHELDVLAFQSVYGKVLIFLVESEEHHTAHALFVFVDVVHQNFHVYGPYRGLLHD